MDLMTEFIEKYKNEFMETHGYKTPMLVNGGGCIDFAHFIAEKIEDELGISFEPISNDFFMNYDDENSDEDSGNINNFFMEHMSQFGVTEEQFKKYKKYVELYAIKSIGYHMWLYDEETNKHYDIKLPEGTNNPFDLPIFKRQHIR